MSETERDANGEDGEQSVLSSIIAIVGMGVMLYMAYAFFSLPFVVETLFGKNESVFVTAFTPGKSTRLDYNEFNDLGGLKEHNTFLGYSVVEVSGITYRSDDVLKSVGIRLADYPAPIPKDIREKIGEICGGGEWKLISPQNSSTIGYQIRSSTHQCLYGYSTDGAGRSHNIVIEVR